MRNGAKINTQTHYDYISREGKYEHIKGRKEDLVYRKSGNMPIWATNNPEEFWHQAEEHRAQKGNAYREFLLGLQEELSLEENIELVERLLKETGIGDKHAYSLAIHDKQAAFDKEHRNIHCHLMFSEKIIERDRPLEADKYFKRYSENDKGEPTQGYKADRTYQSKQGVLELRKLWQDIVNEKLEEKGIAARVDCRTLEEQYDEKIEIGEIFEAQYFKRLPAQHLGKEFQNPIEQREMRLQCEENYEAERNGERVIYPEPQNLHDVKKIIFMRDFVVRKIAKELQRARKENLRLSLKNEEGAVSEKDALVITNTDIISYEIEIQHKLQNEIAALNDRYRHERKGLISNKKSMAKAMHEVYGDEYNANKNNPAILKEYEQDPIVIAKAEEYQREVYIKLAKNEFLGEEYQQCKALYDRTRRKKAVILKQYNSIKNQCLQHKTQELVDERIRLYNELQANNLVTKNLGQRIFDYEKLLYDPANNETILTTADHISEANNQLKISLKELYKLKISKEKELLQAENIIKSAQELPLDTVVFADKIEPLVNLDTKINGENKVGSLPLMYYNNNTYCLIDSTNSNDNNATIRAVKLFDEIKAGKAPVYSLKLSKSGNKPHIISVNSTKSTVRVYKIFSRGDAAINPAQVALKDNTIQHIVDQATQVTDSKIKPQWPQDNPDTNDEIVKQLEQDKQENYLLI